MDLAPAPFTAGKKKLAPKTTRNKAPTKIPDDALIEDVKRYPDDYDYSRARRLNCSKTGMFDALKRLGFSKKKTLEHLKACPIKRAIFQSRLDRFTQQGYPIVYMDESSFQAENYSFSWLCTDW